MPEPREWALSPPRGSNFFHSNMGNLLPARDDVPSANTEYERSSAINRCKFAVANWHGRNSEQLRFLYVGGTYGWRLFTIGVPVLFLSARRMIPPVASKVQTPAPVTALSPTAPEPPIFV